MQGEFKQCPNGHYYQGESCPYCKTNRQDTTSKTEIFDTDGGDRTIAESDYGGDKYSGAKTTVLAGQKTVVNGTETRGTRQATMFGEEDDVTYNQDSQSGSKKSGRYGRKLVGWLVTYSIDELGMDFKLYEGRNIIGRDVDCGIIVNDGRMSGKHAVLLYRANKYSLTDSQSSHGTFVNGEDIELEPRYLKDGDVIQMGNTVFKFRTAL